MTVPVLFDTKNALRKIKRYAAELFDAIRTNERPVKDVFIRPAENGKLSAFDQTDGFSPFTNGSEWGRGFNTYALFYVPLKGIRSGGYLSVECGRNGRNEYNPQFLCRVNGKIRQGLDNNHTILRLDEGDNEVYVIAYTGPKCEKNTLDLSVFFPDPEVEGLYFDIKYPLDTVSFLDCESAEYAFLVSLLYNAVSLIDFAGGREFHESVVKAREYLKKELYSSSFSFGPEVACVGHSHIDCAYLWTLEQTREKVVRSFSTALELMKCYDGFKFMMSQPLLYRFVKEEAPEIYSEIKMRIAEGRWEAEGGMWVEADCNLTSGESLVRQLVYGKRFFREEFGIDSRVLWLPDVFGYSAALPQILKKSGIDWFVTSKISWNDTDRMPFDTFLWKGIDGSAIPSYFITAQKNDGSPSYDHTTYGAPLNAQTVSGAYKRYRPKELNDSVMMTYGYGDGGGGPTYEMLEYALRGARGIPGSPRVKLEKVSDYLTRLSERIKDQPLLPVWQGELYLEFHRGTYTTHANNKKNNRKSETLYQKAEWMTALENSLLFVKTDLGELRRGWEMILTNQFHDILPGSAISEVYVQSDRDYESVKAIGENRVKEAYNAVANRISRKNRYVIFNPGPFSRKGYVEIDGKEYIAPETPAHGYTVTDRLESGCGVKIEGNTAENERYKIVFDDSMQIKSFFDKNAGRELVSPSGRWNELRLYADLPDSYDAWEWQAYSRSDFVSIKNVKSVETVDRCARKGIRIVREFGASEITQTVWFGDFGGVDFETTVDWREKHKMLKTVFCTEINSDKATFDIQFGNVERPAHFNTDWDRAKFETVGQKFADLSEGGYGVALLSDCKYGYDVHDGVIQLSLLRAPTFPDPSADEGKHTFVYSVYPHEGDFRISDTVKEAYALNIPLEAVIPTGDETTVPETFSLISSDKDNVVCETVKPAEDGDGTVFRLYECKNTRTKATLSVGAGFSKAYLCDLLENELSELETEAGTIRLDFRPFEIVTLKLK